MTFILWSLCISIYIIIIMYYSFIITFIIMYYRLIITCIIIYVPFILQLLFMINLFSHLWLFIVLVGSDLQINMVASRLFSPFHISPWLHRTHSPSGTFMSALGVQHADWQKAPSSDASTASPGSNAHSTQLIFWPFACVISSPC